MKRIFGMIALVTAAFNSTGCSFTLGFCGPGRATSSANLHFEGNISSPANWEGTGNVCYTLNMMGKESKHDCPPFATDHPGHFKFDKDITDLMLSGGFVTSTDLYILVNGQRADGQSMSYSQKNYSSNGERTSLTSIIADFALPPSALANATESHDPNAELSGSLQSLGGRASPALAPSVGQRSTASAPELLGTGSATVTLSSGAR